MNNPPHSSRSTSSQLIRKVPWIEAIGTATASGVLYFALGKHELAEFFAVAGSLLALGRLSYTAELEKELTALREPIERMREYLDLSRRSNPEIIREIMQVYVEITEHELCSIKNTILLSAKAQLALLANDKRSQPLPNTEYYGWLLRMIENALPGQRIWALSLMHEGEWDDSPQERQFADKSSQAADRGVRIDRVFIVRAAVMHESLKKQAVLLHSRHIKPDNLRGFIVEYESLNQIDRDLRQRLGEGFTAFDDRVAMVDTMSGNNRGYVTMNSLELHNLRQLFDRLLILGEDIDTVLAKLQTPPAHGKG